jgi:hypothetical protein
MNEGVLVGEPVADADLAYVWGGAPADRVAPRRLSEQKRKTAPEGSVPPAAEQPPSAGAAAAAKQLWALLRS